jgi:hypothetical protein
MFARSAPGGSAAFARLDNSVMIAGPVIAAATRGPHRSTQGPPNAALKPSNANAVVKVVYGGVNHHGSFGKSA